MVHSTRLSVTVLLALLAAGPASADLSLVSSDRNSVTLRFDLGSWELQKFGSGGRVLVNAPGLHMMDSPGRPQLPYASALIALPPGAHVSAAITDGGAIETRDGVRVTIGPRNVWRQDAAGLGTYPEVEDVPPLSNGVWPATDFAVGKPFELRGQRIVAIEVHPFRYDESTARLVAHRSMTLRVTWTGAATGGGAAGEDRYVEPVLRAAVLNYEQGRSFRIARPRPLAPGLFPTRARAAAGTQAFAFDEGQTEVRVKLDSTGVWALDFDDLATNGFPAGVPDSELSVHRHEYLEDQTPPYATLELPVEVQDFNGNDIFDSGDQIVAYVQDWASRSGASIAQRGWGDAEVVYVTSLPGRKGLRMGARDGTPSRTLPPLASYPTTRRFEKNFADLYGFPADTLTDLFDWTGNTTYYDRPDTILFETSQLDTTHGASISVDLQGRKTELHVMFAAIENRLGQFTTLFDSTTAQWYGQDAFSTSNAITGSALSEGRFNHFVLWGKPDPGPPSTPLNNSTGVGLNRFDVSYWRRYQNIRGYLDCNNANAAGPWEIFTPGFADSTFLRAWDVTNPLDPRRMSDARLEKSGFVWDVRFQDSTAAGLRRYIVFNNPKLPPADHFTPVTRRSLENHLAADYLLIVPEAFLPAVQPLVDARQSEGLQVLVAPLESINDEFNGGRHSDYSIKRFIRYAFNQWNSRFVMLVGDGACEDPQNFLGGSGRDWIPAHRILGPVGIFVGGSVLQEIVPSDNWYAWCVTEATCPDSTDHPRVLDLFIGRLPVNSLAEARGAIHKVVGYEAVTPADLWRRRMLLFSDDQYSGENSFGGGGATFGYCKRGYERIFEQLDTVIGSLIVNDAGLHQSEAEVFNMSQYLTAEDTVVVSCGYPGCYDTCRTDRLITQQHARANVTPRLFTRLNDGRLWWNYQGHANEQLLSHEAFYVDNKSTIDDSQNYANDAKPFLFSAFSCHVNNFGRRWEHGDAYQPPFGPGLGADMVTRGNDQGAIASWASTGYELVPTNPVDHLNVEMARAMFSQPPRDPNLGDRGARVVLGESIALTLLRWQTSPSAAAGEREVGLTYALLGDPATRLSIGSPQAFVLANRDTVTSDLAVHLKTPLDTLRLEADLASNQQIVALSLERSIDGAAATVIPSSGYTLSPAFGDTASGGRRYHLTYRTSLTANGYVYTLRTVDRDGTPGHFNVLLPFQCVLRAEAIPIHDGDPVSPNANLSVLVNSPAPLHPASDITLTVNGSKVAFDSTLVAGDPSGRQWILSWTHGAYPIDSYVVTVTSSSGASCPHQFKVDVGGGELRIQNALAFPNPFDDDRGTYFSFTLVSGTSSDLLVRVYTLTGRLIYTRTERQLLPGYHQLPWDGRDAEGSTIADGIYVYRIVANNGSSSTNYQGRLVKLRRPRHEVVP